MFKIKKGMQAVFFIIIILVLFTACKDKKNADNDSEYAQNESLCPVLCVSDEGYLYNYMQPYDIQMDAASVYGCLIPAYNGENIRFKIVNDWENILSAEYFLYDYAGKLLENGSVSDNNLSQTGEFDICLNSLTAEEARLEIKLCFDGIDNVYFYSRVTTGRDICKDLQYVMDIEDACLKKESPVDITLCMEWDLVTSKQSYFESDINSSYEQVTWAGLNIAGKTSDYYINIVDYSDDIVSFSVNYGIYSNDDEPRTYQVSDFLRVRQLDGEQFLLNFYRNTNENFYENEDSFSDSQIYLGVVSGKEDYILFEEDKELFFVQNQSLYYYDIENQAITCVYSPKEVLGDTSLFNSMNSISLLNKKENYFYFMLGGYLCDDMHKGSCGLAIMRYDVENNTCRELYFRPTKYNYRLIMDELDIFSYMNSEGSIYFISNGEIHSYNIDTNTLKEEIKNVSIEDLVVSYNSRNIGWNKKQDSGEDTIVIRNLDTHEEHIIEPETGTQITPIGFVKDDFVYGISDINENNAGVSSENQILMHNICIVDETGALVKEYQQEGNTRVTGGYTSDTVIVLNMANKVEKGTLYNVNSQQQIVSGSKSDTLSISKKEIRHSDKGNIWVLNFEENIPGACLFMDSSITIDDESKIITEPAELSTYYKGRYFLYAKGSLYGTYKVMREALVEASKLAGVVTDAENTKLYYRQAKAKTASVLVQDHTLAAELLSDENGVVSAWASKTSEATVIDISGFLLEDMLLFISKGFPVLGRYDETSFVWIVGYTEDAIKCQKSDSQEVFEISKEDAENIFSKTGYEFYTCNN